MHPSKRVFGVDVLNPLGTDQTAKVVSLPSGLMGSVEVVQNQFDEQTVTISKDWGKLSKSDSPIRNIPGGTAEAAERLARPSNPHSNENIPVYVKETNTVASLNSDSHGLKVGLERPSPDLSSSTSSSSSSRQPLPSNVHKPQESINKNIQNSKPVFVRPADLAQNPRQTASVLSSLSAPSGGRDSEGYVTSYASFIAPVTNPASGASLKKDQISRLAAFGLAGDASFLAGLSGGASKAEDTVQKHKKPRVIGNDEVKKKNLLLAPVQLKPVSLYGDADDSDSHDDSGDDDEDDVEDDADDSEGPTKRKPKLTDEERQQIRQQQKEIRDAIKREELERKREQEEEKVRRIEKMTAPKGLDFLITSLKDCGPAGRISSNVKDFSLASGRVSAANGLSRIIFALLVASKPTEEMSKIVENYRNIMSIFTAPFSSLSGSSEDSNKASAEHESTQPTSVEANSNQSNPELAETPEEKDPDALPNRLSVTRINAIAKALLAACGPVVKTLLTTTLNFKNIKVPPKQDFSIITQNEWDNFREGSVEGKGVPLHFAIYGSHALAVQLFVAIAGADIVGGEGSVTARASDEVIGSIDGDWRAVVRAVSGLYVQKRDRVIRAEQLTAIMDLIRDAQGN